jgi:hypothetical protein
MKRYYGVLYIGERHQAEVSRGQTGRDIGAKRLALGLAAMMPKFEAGELLMISCPFCPDDEPKPYKPTQVIYFNEKDGIARMWGSVTLSAGERGSLPPTGNLRACGRFPQSCPYACVLLHRAEQKRSQLVEETSVPQSLSVSVHESVSLFLCFSLLHS